MALQCQIRWHDGAIYLFNWEIYPIFGQFWGRAVRRTSQDSNLGLGRFRFSSANHENCGSVYFRMCKSQRLHKFGENCQPATTPRPSLN